MGILRYRIDALGGFRGLLGGQIDAAAEDPLVAGTLSVGSTATTTGAQPVAPASGDSLFATIEAVDVPIYTDVAAAPDPTAEPRLLLIPGRPQLVHIAAGHRIAAILASDITLPASGGGGGGGAVTNAGTFAVQNTAATTAGENHIGGIGGTTKRAYASFTRPANTTAYAAGQLVANNTAAASVAPIALAVARVIGGTGAITCAKLSKSGTSIANASFRAHFYRNSPTASNGDGGAWLTTSSIYLGFADITVDKVFTDEASGTGVPKDAAGNPRSILFDTASGSQSIYALLEARGAYTPVSGEVFTLTAEVLGD